MVRGSFGFFRGAPADNTPARGSGAAGRRPRSNLRPDSSFAEAARTIDVGRRAADRSASSSRAAGTLSEIEWQPDRG